MRLVIDGNAFINVAISVTKGVTSRDQRIGEVYYVTDIFSEGGFILKEAVRVSFRNFCFTYLNSIISPLSSNLSSVHIVFDSKSWRKEFVSSFFKLDEESNSSSKFTYKGHRKYDDMHHLFFDYFQKTLVPAWQSAGNINCHSIDGAEGDDIVAYICEKFQDDIVIYSVDQDLKQLVTGENRNVILILPKQTHKFKRLISPVNIFKPSPASESLLDDFFSLDSFTVDSPIEKVIRSLREKDYVEQKSDLTSDVLTKILLGDKSDNVPRLPNLTPSRANKVISAILTNFERPVNLIDCLDEQFICFCVDQISIVTKTKDPADLEKIKSHLVFNIRILRLSSQVFPKDIQVGLENHFESFEPLKFNLRGFQDLKNNQVYL